MAASSMVISSVNAFNPQNVEQIHVKKGITTNCKEKLKLQEPLSIELPTENSEICCDRRKAQRNQTGSVKVALKRLQSPFLSDSGKIFSGLVLLDTASETTLANQLGIQGPKQNLTVRAVEGVRTTFKSQ